MKKQIINNSIKIANKVGFFNAYGTIRRGITKSQIAILMYHRIGPRNDRWSLESISLNKFKQQIEYFCKKREILSLEELIKYIKDRKSLPRKAIAVTFDDGYKDNYLFAYPILKKYKVPATFFLTSGHISSDKLFWWDIIGYIIQNTNIEKLNLLEFGFMSLKSFNDKNYAQNRIIEKLKTYSDTRRMSIIEELMKILNIRIPRGLGQKLILTWDEVKEMHIDGITFGGHTINHTILTNIPLKQAEYEIIESKKDIEKILNKEITAFSYPNGSYNNELINTVKKAGFACAVSVLPSRLIKPQDNIYSLKRISLSNDESELKMVYSGFFEDWKTLQTKILKK